MFTYTMDNLHLVATNQGMSNDWVLDSGASFHANPNREWFTNYTVGGVGRVILGNGIACNIVSVGDVQVCFENGSTFTLHDVRHVPLLTKNLVNAGQLDDDARYTCTFADCSWKISKGALQIARGLKTSTLYVLHVSKFCNNVICIAKQPSVSFWHFSARTYVKV